LGTIINKLDALVRDTPVHIDYVYYAFKFPILRNRIAHGHMLRVDVRQAAHLLLLDLYDCCRIVREHPGAPNALVELLRRVKPDLATFADVVEFVSFGHPVFEAALLWVEKTLLWPRVRALFSMILTANFMDWCFSMKPR